MTKSEKLKAYEEKAKKANELFRDIRSGKFRKKPPRERTTKIMRAYD